MMIKYISIWLDMKNKLDLIWKVIAIVCCIIVFTILAILVGNNDLQPLAVDAAVRDFFYTIRGEKGGLIYWVFRLLTEFGYTYVIVTIIILYAFRTKFDYRVLVLAIGMIFAHLLNSFIKGCFDRPRPEMANWWMEESSSSFPSGHSSSATFFYSFLFYLVYHSDEEKWLKKVIMIICSVLILIVTSSRLVLGVHFFSDVIGGMCVGFICSILCMFLCELFKKKNIFVKPLFGKKE